MTEWRGAAAAEALIVGGGVAGASLAILLARQGRAVQILEQSSAMHHKVCGEFLSREAVAYLGQCGVDLRALGAVEIHGIRLAARGPIAACELPFPALSITRQALDEALLSLASRTGAEVLRGRRVEALRPEPGGWAAYLEGGEVRRAPTAFLATGKHDLGGRRRPAGTQNDLVAFKMYFRLSPSERIALCGWVELFLFPGGYAGLQLVEDDQANLCLLVNRKTLRDCRNHWPALLQHLRDSSAPLAARLHAAQPLLPKPLALSSIPYGMLLSQAEPGLWRLGDQAAVIPSFSGDGISIALHSARLAAEVYMRGGTAEEFAHRLCAQLIRPVRLASALSRLMVAAPALAHGLRLWPGLLSQFATLTRVPQSAWMPAVATLQHTGAPS